MAADEFGESSFGLLFRIEAKQFRIASHDHPIVPSPTKTGHGIFFPEPREVPTAFNPPLTRAPGETEPALNPSVRDWHSDCCFTAESCSLRHFNEEAAADLAP